MNSVNALELRQSMGKVVSELERGGEPVLLIRGHRPVAALISLKDFNERFVEWAAARERDQIVDEMNALIRPSADTTPTVDILRGLRDQK